MLNAAGAAGFVFGPAIGGLYELSPYLPYALGAVMMLALLVAQHLSPVLRQAGYRPAAVEMIEEAAETPLSSV